MNEYPQKSRSTLSKDLLECVSTFHFISRIQIHRKQVEDKLQLLKFSSSFFR